MKGELEMRTPREVSHTGIYHVMARGNGKQEIFLDEVDNRYFLKLLIEAKNRHDSEIYAYCIMGNHYHLLVKSGNLSDFCKEINQTYAHYYNAKNKTVGHVFQSRYKSFPVENGEYLTCVLRYIHNNPVKAGMVEHPKDYFWSSYKEYLSGEGLTTTGPILDLFDAKLPKAREKFISFSETADDFNYEASKAQEHFLDYKRSVELVKNWPLKDNKADNEEIFEMKKAICSQFCLSDKEIIDVLGISNGRYYGKIAKME